MDESIRVPIVLIGVSVIIINFIRSPLVATMYIIALQKVIDILWFIKVPLGSFDLSMQRVVYTVLPLALLMVVVGRGRKVEFPLKMPMKIVLTVFAICVGVNVFRSPFLSDAIADFFKIAGSYIVFGAGWYYFDNEEKFDQFAKLFIFTYLISFVGLILQLTGIFQLADIGVAQQLASNYGVEGRGERYAGFYNDSATQAMYLYTLIPLCLYMLEKRNTDRKWMYYAMLGVAGLATYFSFSRGVWISVGLQIAFWLLLNRKFLGFGAIIGLVFVGLTTNEFLQGFFSDILERQTVAGSGRDALWGAITTSFDNGTVVEKIFGQGLLSHSLTLQPLFPDRDYSSGQREKGHSDFYEYLHDLGYVGFALYAVIVVWMTWIIINNIALLGRRKYPKELELKYKVWAVMLVFYVINIIGYSSRWPSFTWPFWFIAGLVFKPPQFFMQQAAVNPADEVIDVNPKLSPQPYY
ncbi:MAG: hypothetical protein IAF08_14255 [Rhizobacter sp.]|nr:hypothetical protein [Chlorobiales bacterium]